MPNTVIINQAKGTFTFKSYPADTVRSNLLQFTVLDAANYEVAFGFSDTLVFSKETVTVHIVYKNIGNKEGDSAVVIASLPNAGMRIVPGSTAGSVSGNSVTWSLRNIKTGIRDSVQFKIIVDSTVAINTQLQIQADLNWQSSNVSAERTFIVSSFPRLKLSVLQDRSVVGSGKSIEYQISVTNTGSSPALNTTVYDTISTFGSYQSSTMDPEQLSSDKRIMQWNLGTIQPQSSKQLRLVVASQPDIGNQQLRNSTAVKASNETTGDIVTHEAYIVPIVPKTISIVPSPRFVFGQVNKDSSRISVTVRDSQNVSMPDGVEVQLFTSIGTFSNNASSISTIIRNGIAQATLRSINVESDIIETSIRAQSGNPQFGTVQDSVTVSFYPGAVRGTIVSGSNKTPFAGAIAKVTNNSMKVIGADTTKLDGQFFIPLAKNDNLYELELFVIDKFGDSIKAKTFLDPSKFPLPPIVIPNALSGRIEYSQSGEPVPAENVTVFLDSIASGIQPTFNANINYREAAKSNSFIRIQEQKTNATGKFTFLNLTPARYIISVDSVEFPKFSGFAFVADTGSGTFSINLNLKISLDSSVHFKTGAVPISRAGDTIDVGIRVINNGTAQHRSVEIRDTLSRFATFISATKGNFTSVSYDSANRIVLWQRDTIRPLDGDSITLRYFVSKNIPNNTMLSNRIWYSSNLVSSVSTSPTTIQSSGAINFSNRFVVPRDTIIAGDSLRHVFRFANTGTDSIRGVRIVDTVFSAGMTGISLSKRTIDSTNISDSVTTIFIGSIAPGKEDSVSLTLTTDFALRSGVTISSHAYVMIGDSILARSDTSFIVNENPHIASFLKIIKTANKKVAEIGDIVTYQITVNNASPQVIREIGLYDLLPYAFKYVKNSARWNGKAIEPVMHSGLNQLKWNLADTLHSAKQATLVYQLAIGADAMESAGMNTAYASATAGIGTTLISAPSQWQVTVRPGVFSEKGLIIGKIFYDDNRNAFQDEGENGEKGIELWMEDGTKIITGDDGKFSLPEVKPGQHVMRVNEQTLPPYTHLLGGTNAFAKDPSSRFVRVTEGGIAKANFYLKRNVSDTVKQTVAKVNKLTAVRQVKPKYLFKDTLRNYSLDTVEMFISFTYSGNKPVASIEVFDHLHDRFFIISGSATFNGKTIIPQRDKKGIRWNLGASKAAVNGVLKYKAVLNFAPGESMVVTSVSRIRITAVDGTIVESNAIVSENIIKETKENRIETSLISTSTVIPEAANPLFDSISITAGDELFLKTSLFIDPKKNITDARLIDTLPSGFIVNERSFTVNGIPAPAKSLTVRIRSMALSASTLYDTEELEFMRISSLDAANMLRPGMNEVTFSARLQSVRKDTLLVKRSYAIITDEFNDERIVQSNDAFVFLQQHSNHFVLALETTYVNIPRSTDDAAGKIADAVNLVTSLKMNSSASVVMDGITFETGRVELTQESKILLDAIAKSLLQNSDIRLQINGYTDNTGNASANIRVSLNRAKEVVRYLNEKGINMSRLRAQGFGSANPLASNKTKEGRAKNRRVEFAPLN